MLAAGLKGMKPRPYIHNHAIELRGKGRATGTVYVELRSPAVNWEWIGTGYYDDDYEKVGGRVEVQVAQDQPGKLHSARRHLNAPRRATRFLARLESRAAAGK